VSDTNGTVAEFWGFLPNRRSVEGRRFATVRLTAWMPIQKHWDCGETFPGGISCLGATFSGLEFSSREGRMSFTPPGRFNASAFSIFQRSMMQSDELPLSELINDEMVQAALDHHQVNFGQDPQAVYTPALTLWGLISQALFAAADRSCKAAVLRIASYWAAMGRRVCDTDSGAYCRARAKIPYQAVREITVQLAANVEAAVDRDTRSTLPDAKLSPEELQEIRQSPEVLAQVQTNLPEGRLLMVDGCTVTAADTPENQAEYPQNPAQEEGLGFPIIRCVTLISLTTGLLVDAETGPYSGKESGETALLWKLLDRLQPGDILVADSYYCTYWLVAACLARGVKIVMKNHHKRDDHPLDARRINKYEREVTWELPQRPKWMSEEVYSQQPETVSIRLVVVAIEQPGFRTTQLTVATTLLDHKSHTATWIGSVYRSRWLIELDIRSIKCTLGMEVLRAKTPEMVRTELWSCLLAYNLIRAKMLQSAATSGRDIRSMSFTTTKQLLGSNWLLCAVIGVTNELAELGQQASQSERVGDRPDRVEPRVNKRRPKVLALMSKPRAEYANDLATSA
jgi:hypothetical protein